MEQLGTMEPEQLLRLLLGVISCALVMVVVTIVYIVLARRMRRERSSPVRPLRLDEYMRATEVSDRQEGTSLLSATARSVETGHAAEQTEGAQASRERPVQRAPEILRVVQDISSGQIAIQIAGTRYNRLSEVHDQALGKRILAAVTWALRFSGGRVAEDDGITSLQLPPCDTVPMPESQPPWTDEDVPGEIMRLLGDAERDAFWVQVAGRCYARLDDVADPDVALRILWGISSLLQFSRGRLMTDEGVRSVPIPKLTAKTATSVVRALAASREPPGRSLRDQEDRLFPSRMRDSEGPGQRTRRIFADERRARPTRAHGTPTSLVEEIDRIFQRKLEASPYAHLDAQFVERPDGGVQIRVGTKFYESPEEVPDPGLREIIKAAIAEW